MECFGFLSTFINYVFLIFLLLFSSYPYILNSLLVCNPLSFKVWIPFSVFSIHWSFFLPQIRSAPITFQIMTNILLPDTTDDEIYASLHDLIICRKTHTHFGYLTAVLLNPLETEIQAKLSKCEFMGQNFLSEVTLWVEMEFKQWMKDYPLQRTFHDLDPSKMSDLKLVCAVVIGLS